MTGKAARTATAASLIGEYRAVREVVVDQNYPRDGLCCHADRPPLRIGLSITPKVNRSVSYRHAQIVYVRPRLLLQFVKQRQPCRGIGKGHFKLRAGARDHLDQVRTADDADEIAILVDDRGQFISSAEAFFLTMIVFQGGRGTVSDLPESSAELREA